MTIHSLIFNFLVQFLIGFLFLLFHLTNYSPLHLNSLYILEIAFGVNSSSKGELELE